MIKNIFLLLFILSYYSISFAQSKNYATDWYKYNLKHHVKEIRTIYIYQDNGPEEKAKFYRNRAAFDGAIKGGGELIKFDTLGFMINSMAIRLKENYISVYTLDSLNENINDSIALNKSIIYNYFPKDIAEKQNLSYKLPYDITYQVYSPYYLKLDEYSHQSNIQDEYKKNFKHFEYTFTEDLKINGYKEYLPLLKDTVITNEKPVERVVYKYNDKGQVVETQHFYWEDRDAWGILNVWLDERFDIKSRDQVKHAYQYDNEGRIKKMTLWVNNQEFWEDNYTYRKNGSGLEKKVVYYIRSPSYHLFVSPYTEFTYNEYGDVVQAKDMDSNKNVTDVRTYTYEYDKYCNWTTLWMYANGEKEPYIKGERLIKYFEQ